MLHKTLVYILGDVHGSFGRLNEFINKKIRMNKTLMAIAARCRQDNENLRVLILQCGDFAWFWPLCDSSRAIQNRVNFLPEAHVSIYWTGGNHEDWDELDRLGPGISEVAPHIFYCSFGSTLALSPEITVLFAGGAESADKDWRLMEMLKGAPKIWWEQEGISNADMARLAKVPKANWVISHTAPASFNLHDQMADRWGAGHETGEPSRNRLEQVFIKYDPQKWFFGHFHHYMTGRTDGCDWECLAALGSGEKSWDKIYVKWEDENN